MSGCVTRNPSPSSRPTRRSRPRAIALAATALVASVFLAPMDPPAAADTHDARAGGYWMLAGDGTVHPFGSSRNHGDPSFVAGFGATALASTPTGLGYFVTSATGATFGYGDADQSLAGAGPTGRAASRWTALHGTPSGLGLWWFSDRGEVHTAGDAPFLGDLSALTLDGSIIAAAVTPTGLGYYMIGSDGGVFAFGDAAFHGSIPQILPGVTLDGAIVGISPTPTNRGYWLVASDGGVFAFGDAGFRGSVPGVLAPGTALARPVNGMVAYGTGYLMVASDGGVFNFSEKEFLGSLGANPPASPVVGISPFPSEPTPQKTAAPTPAPVGELVELTSVVDGDTFRARLSNGSTESIRLIGINAPEMSECMAPEATAALTVLLRSGDIRLVTDTSERDRFGRLLRYVFVGGRHVNAAMVGDGLALSTSFPPDVARSTELSDAQTRAAAAGVGVWSPSACGAAAETDLMVSALLHDAPGDDNFNLNGEWVEITNAGTTRTPLAGWVMKDTTASHRYSFPATFVLDPGRTVRLHTGCGLDTSTTLHWCNRDSAIWNNTGDTAFLLDPAGNIHDMFTYVGTRSTTTTTTPRQTTTTAPPTNCHPAYPTVCIPPAPPDLDCADVPFRNFRVLPPDPHRFDGNKDGVGCQS